MGKFLQHICLSTINFMKTKKKKLLWWEYFIKGWCLIDLGCVFSEDRSVLRNTLFCANLNWDFLLVLVSDSWFRILPMWHFTISIESWLILQQTCHCYHLNFSICNCITKEGLWTNLRTICFGHHGTTLKRANWLSWQSI